MKTIVYYYSNKGSNRYLANKIAGDLKCEIEEIKPRLNSHLLMLMGLNFGNRKLKTKVEDFDRVILCGPIWMGKLIVPLKNFVKMHSGEINKLKMLFVILIIALTSCEKDEVEQIDNLEQLGVLGKWGLQSITINGITDMSIRYDTIEFITDSEPGDLKGEFRSTGAGYETTGIFELNTLNKTIEFIYDDKRLFYEMQILNNVIVFSYSENNASIVERWRKEE